MDKWPRQRYSEIRRLPEAERAAALAAVPGEYRAWVALYLSMPEEEFVWMKKAASISRLKGREKRNAALTAIPEERREQVRAQAVRLFYQRRPRHAD